MAALKGLTTNADVETLLNDVFAPIAKEVGVQLTAKDVQEYADSVTENETLSLDDLKDVNGGYPLAMIPLVGKIIKGVITVFNTVK